MASSPIYQNPGISTYDECNPRTHQESTGNVVRTALWICIVVYFSVSIVKDTVRALRRSAHWIPGDFLVLSAFTIQLLNLLGKQDEPDDKSQYGGITLGKFWMNHTSRIMLCVVVAYLMPNMANPGSKEIWDKCMSLGLSSFLQIVSDLYIFHHYDSKSPTSNLSRLWPKQLGISIRFYYLLATLFYTSIVMLFLLLVCSKIAGKGIERIVAIYIPVIYERQVEEEDHHHHNRSYIEAEKEEEENFYDPNCKYCWRRVEDALMRSWIVVRAYSVEYVIARSPLTFCAGIIVTFQIVITIVGGVWNSPKLILRDKFETLSFTASILQCVFILIGWVTITWRWSTAVANYKIRQSDAWSSFLRVEDFWTRYLRDLMQVQEPRTQQAVLLDFKIRGLVGKEKLKEKSISMSESIFWYTVIWLQLLVVFLSKACWLGSLMIFHNKLMGKLLSLILPNHELYVFEGYPMYQKILDDVRMLGDSPKSLWLANRKSIAKAKNLIFLGKEDGEFLAEDLVDFLCNKKTEDSLGLSCLEPYKRQTRLRFLCRTRQQPKDSDVEMQRSRGRGKEQFAGLSTKSSKMAAVSLLSIIVHLSPIYAAVDKEKCPPSDFPEAVKNCVKAYSQAWEIIDFVEEADTEADVVNSKAADKYFEALQKKVEKGCFLLDNRSHATPQCVRAALLELKKKSKRETEPVQGSPNGWEGNDSTDWKAAAWGLAVYNLCNSIECNDGVDVIELLKELESSLADIINECLKRIQYILMLNSKKWALNSDERRLVKALYTAGKARTIMDHLVMKAQRNR